MKRLLLASLIALASCAQTPDPVVEKPVIVEKPVAVACVDKSKVPAEPAKVAGDLNGQARHDLDVVSASALELRTWGRKLYALVQPCTKP
jgi:hypothetical protein